MWSSLAFLITFLMMTTSSSLFAQKLTIGIQAGFNASNTVVSNKDDFTDQIRIYTPLLLYSVNAYLGYKGNSSWGLSIEPGFIQKGGLRKDLSLRHENIQYEPQDVKLVSGFIQLPILIDLHINDRLIVGIGPELALFLNAKAKSQTFTFNIANGHDKLEIAGIASINYNLVKGIDIGLRYNHGITSPSYLAWFDDFGNALGFSKQYYQYIQFNVRLKINRQ